MDLHKAGSVAQAVPLYREFLKKNPTHAEALHLAGVAMSSQGEHDEASACLEKAIQLVPQHPLYLNNLGEVRRHQGRLDEAVAFYNRAMLVHPKFPEAYYNLGNVLKMQGKHEEAVAAYEQALRLRPNYAKAIYNLANSHREQGKTQISVGEYLQAISLNPNWRDPHLNLGNALYELKQCERAIHHYREAQKYGPPDPDIDGNIGNVMMVLGDAEGAIECYRRALRGQASGALAELRLASIAETIPPSDAYIDAYRAQLMAKLDQLIESDAKIRMERLNKDSAEPQLVLNYQGRNELPLRKRYADFYTKQIQPLDPEGTPAGERPRIGIVVSSGHEGVFNECIGGLVQQLDHDVLDVHIVSQLAGVNRIKAMFKNPRMKYFVMPDETPAAAEAIRDGKFDLLHYWEIGTDGMNYFLPYFRPAPVQTTGWGWPATTGNPHMQYFLSSELLEEPGAQQYYSEKLVCFKTLPTYYRRPPVAEKVGPRVKHGLADGQRVYVCNQNMRKYHPDADSVLAQILERDPAALLVLVGDTQPTVIQRLMRRLSRAMPESSFARIKVAPWMDRTTYLDLLANADVVLDTFHYGGGANTLCDAYAAGAPVVTLPGQFCRGRYAGGTHTKTGIPELIARSREEYVEIALRVVREGDWRQSLRERVLAAAPMLFEERAAVIEHQAFFLAAARGQWKG